MRTVDVAIVGGGIIGCATARELALRGQRVVVLERDRVGIGASSRNSGVVRLMGREPEELPLVVESLRLWTELALAARASFEYVRAGCLWLASTDAELAGLQALIDRERSAGLFVNQAIDAAEARRLVPALSDRFVGGILGGLDGHLDQVRATAAVATLAESAGAEIRQGVAVESLEPGRGMVLHTSAGRVRAEKVLVAAGAWAVDLLASWGRRLPIALRRGQAFRTQPLPHLTDLVLVAPQPGSGHVAIRQLRSGAVTVSGYRQPEYVGLDQRTTERTQRFNRDTAELTLPVLRNASIEERWAGVNDVSPDNLPLLGADKRLPGVFLATGFSGHGFSIAPAVARGLADLIIDGTTRLPLEPFRVDRFDHLDVDDLLTRFTAHPTAGLWVGREQLAPVLRQG